MIFTTRDAVRRILIVARWEWLASVTRASFIVMAVGLPVVQLALAALIGASLQRATDTDEEAAPEAMAIVVPRDMLGVSAHSVPGVMADEAAALRALRDGTVGAVVVLADDHSASGRVRLYSKARQGLFAISDGVRHRQQAEDAIRRVLVSSWPVDGRRERLVTPIVTVEAHRLAADGAITPETGRALGILGGAFGVALLLGLAILLAAGLLQEAMTVERENRMLELLLVAIRPLELLVGKVLGLGAAGLTQMGIYLVLALSVAPGLLGLHDVPVSMLAWSAGAFLAGYVLFASVLAATGTFGRDPQSSAQLSTLWILAGASPMFFITFISADPNSTIPRVLTWIPVTSPVALLLRLGSGPVAAGEIAAALTLTLVTSAAILAVSAVLLRRVALGQPLLLGGRASDR